MLVSVFTPTHRPTHLQEAWDSLKAQTYENWEWVVVPNGSLENNIKKKINEMTGNDSRVKICDPRGIEGIGALKRFACKCSSGELMVELDHDDMLLPTCLQTLVSISQANGKNVFIYSDSICEDFEGNPVKFSSNFGWLHYTSNATGRPRHVNATHAISPAMLSDIRYSPDHVRAWDRIAYETAGGHDPKLAVCDDQELVIRMYLNGTKFVQLQRALYVHRFDKGTTSGQKAEEITNVSTKIRDASFHPLVKEWCRRRKYRMLDLGGYTGSEEHYTPIDVRLPATDVSVLGNEPEHWPNSIGADVFAALNAMPDSSVGAIRANDFLEHVPAARIVELFNLVYAKLVPGGYFLTHTPAMCDNDGRCGRGAFQDPTHVSFWSSNNFWYYTDRDYAKFVEGVCCRFQTVRVCNYYPGDFHRLHLIPYVLWDGMSLKESDVHYYPGQAKI
jgi:glycosyltransferase involved in cell wall biosynthesis